MRHIRLRDKLQNLKYDLGDSVINEAPIDEADANDIKSIIDLVLKLLSEDVIDYTNEQFAEEIRNLLNV